MGSSVLILTCYQVRAAVSALKDVRGLPEVPADFVSPVRGPDMLDFLHFVFGFQVRF